MMKNKKLYTAVGLMVLICAAAAGFYFSSLAYRLDRLAAGKDCRVGAAVIAGSRSFVYEEGKYPLLSVFKLFIAVRVLDELERANADPDKVELTITRSMIDERTYSPMRDERRTYPYGISVARLLEYMVAESDNNAADILLAYTGGTEQMQAYLKRLGFGEIEVSANEKEMNADIAKQYVNRASPADVVRFLKTVREGDILTPENRKFFDKIMTATVTGGDKLKAGLPQGTVFGHKTGSSSRTAEGIKIADNDAGFVILPDGRTYYIAVMVSDSRMSDRENAALAAEISAVVYNRLR